MGLAKRFQREEWGDRPIPAHVLRFFGQEPKRKPQPQTGEHMFTDDSMVNAMIEDAMHASPGEIHDDPYADLTPADRADLENWVDEQDRLDAMDRDLENERIA